MPEDSKHLYPIPFKPTMGMWDDFCEIFPVPMDKFEAAYKHMVAGLNKCPFPIKGDDGTREQCIAHGNCGCDYGNEEHHD